MGARLRRLRRVSVMVVRWCEVTELTGRIDGNKVNQGIAEKLYNFFLGISLFFSGK